MIRDLVGGGSAASEKIITKHREGTDLRNYNIRDA